MFLILLFCTSYTLNNVVEIHVKYLNVNSIYLLCIFSLLFFVIACIRKYDINRISIMLVISIAFGVIPLMYTTNLDSYFGNYLTVIISGITFYIISNTKKDFTDIIYKLLCLISLIISVQVIYTEYMIFGNLSFSNISNESIKLFMKIPIGSSNLIAAFLLPLLIFIESYGDKSRIKHLICLINIYSLVLCRSKNALSLFFIIIFYLFAKRIYFFIIKDKSFSKNKKLIIIMFINAMLLLGVILTFNIILNILNSLRFDYYISPLSNGILNKIDTISSGRVVVYLDEINRIKDHIIFGNGFAYELGMKRSHNWVIDLLVQRGIIGLYIYSYCLYNILKIRLNNKDKFIKSSFNLLLVIFIQGLFEVTVFTLGIDLLIWSISGFMYARYRYLRNKQKLITNI